MFCQQIPISTLKAVSGLLSNTAASTSFKVEKSDSINAGGYGESNGYGQSSGYGQAGGLIDGSSQYGESAHTNGGYSHGAGGNGQYGHSAQINSGFDHTHGSGLGYNGGGLVDSSGQYGHSAQIRGEFDHSHGGGNSGFYKEANFATGGLFGGHLFGIF